MLRARVCVRARVSGVGVGPGGPPTLLLQGIVARGLRDILAPGVCAALLGGR